MSAVALDLLATDDIGLVGALPFAAPALILFAGLLVVLARDRLRSRQ